MMNHVRFTSSPIINVRWKFVWNKCQTMLNIRQHLMRGKAVEFILNNDNHCTKKLFLGKSKKNLKYKMFMISIRYKLYCNLNHCMMHLEKIVLQTFVRFFVYSNINLLGHVHMRGLQSADKNRIQEIIFYIS